MCGPRGLQEVEGGAVNNSADGIGRAIAEQVILISGKHMSAWERILRLHIKPRPKWLPAVLWAKLIKLVLVQSEEIVR